ncbi:MAG: MlaD family protein [Bacillota bacterium]
MRDIRKTQIKVGITSLFALILLVFIIGWAKNFKLTSDQKKLTIRFESANGLEVGDIVTVNGVRKGVVDDIEISGNNAIVRATLDADVKLKEDATFGISMLDLMGGKKVEIRQGTAEKELDYAKVQTGKFYADVPAVMAMLGSVQDDLVKIIKDLQVTLSSVNNILSDKEFNSQLKSSVANLSGISQKLNVMIDENRSNFRQLTGNTAELTKEANAFMKENKEKFKASLDEVQVVMQNTNALLERINKITDETTSGKNNLGKILYDEQLLTDVKTSLQQVKDLTKVLMDQLKDKGLNVDAHIKLF